MSLQICLYACEQVTKAKPSDQTNNIPGSFLDLIKEQKVRTFAFWPLDTGSILTIVIFLSISAIVFVYVWLVLNLQLCREKKHDDLHWAAFRINKIQNLHLWKK